jgi:PAS domain S-box-containing protein
MLPKDITILKKYCVYIVCITSLILLSVSIPTRSEATGPDQKVLLLNSYHAGYKWTDDITAAVRDVLSSSGDIDLYVEYLDTRRQESSIMMERDRLFLLMKYGDVLFDVIICADNNSLDFLLKNRGVLFHNVPIVFCGINSFTERLLQGQKNITGVIEAVDIRNTVDLMLSLHPETSRILVINDGTEEGHGIHNEALVASNHYSNIKWYLPQLMTIEELVSEISSLHAGDLVLLGSFSRDFDGKHLEYDKIAKLVSANSSIPVYCLWDFYMGHGIVGGRLASAGFQGKKAATMVMEILAGKKADDIPITKESPNHYFADFQVMQRFNIGPEKWPVDTIFINRPPDFYVTHKLEIWSALTVITILSILTILLSLAVIDKKKAELGLRRLASELSERVEERTEQLSATVDELKSNKEQMQHLLSNLSGMVYRCNYDKKWTMQYMSQAAMNITGYRPEEIINNSLIAYGDLIDPRDEQLVDETVAKAIREKTHFTLEYRITTKDGATKWVWEQGLAVYDSSGEVLYLDGLISDISERKAIEHEHKRLATVVHQTDDLVALTDLTGRIEYVNNAFVKVTGYSANEVLGRNLRILKSNKQDRAFYSNMWHTLKSGEVWRGRLFNTKKDGSEYIADGVILPIRDDSGEIVNFVGLQRDITHELSLENNLRQAQKLEAMGTLAGGIAHEINTPAQYVASNLDFFLESFTDLHDFFKDFITLNKQKAKPQKIGEEIDKLLEKYDVDYLFEEIPTALNQSIDGIAQISKIVHSMKQFAHPGDDTKTAANINEAITNTANVCRNEWKYVAEIEFNLDPQLPEVPCHRSEINQVFLNIIVNAAHAIAANTISDDKKGLITITTGKIDHGVEIAFRDTGSGIPENLKERIFDPFFTTKEPGKGTGQGLAIAHSIITEKHKGKIFVESKTGQGTTFFIHLPIEDDA